MKPRRSRGVGVALSACCAVACWTSQDAFFGFSASSRAARTARAATSGPAEGQYRLRYFDGKGVVETARMLFAIAGIDYEDKRYSVTFGTPGDFTTISRPEFDADKAAGRMDVAMGKVPILENAGSEFMLPQSKSIERYLARKFGMMGSTEEEGAWVDAIGEHLRDINDVYNKKGMFFMKDAEKKAELQKTWFEQELPPMLQNLEKVLPGSAGFAVGSTLSLADVQLYKLLKDTYGDQDISAAYASCPKLQAIVSKLQEHQGLQKWIAERPKTMF